MKIPKTSEELENELYSSIDILDEIGDLRIRQLIRRLSKVSDNIIVSGIIKIFANTNRPDTQYADQKYAGKLLKELKPKTKRDLGLVLKSTIENWNKSVEEFPFWLEENYGIELLRNTLTDLEAQNLNDIQVENLKTMKWWLKI